MRLITRELALFLMAFCMFGGTPANVQAGFIISAETVDATPGDTGYIQILLKNDFSSDQTLSAFSVEVKLSGPGVQFIGVDDQTTPGFVFDGFGTGTLTFDSFPNSGFILSDLSLNSDGFVTLNPAQTVGLGRIEFEVKSGISGGLRPITFIRGSVTLLTDANGDPYADSDITLNNGGINVQGNPVPEPSSFIMGLVACGYGLFARRRKQPPESSECR